MERECIATSKVHEIVVLATPPDTAKAAVQSILQEVIKYPHIRITHATGETMIPLSDALRAMGAKFEEIEAFHLDEYYPYAPTGRFSFVRFLFERFFTPLGVKLDNIYTLNGLAENASVEAIRYEDLLAKRKVGLAILGIGPGGHVGFNEIGTPLDSRTHLQQLSKETIYRDRVERHQDTPQTALTQGIGNILEAERIILIAYGPAKGKILNQALSGEVCTDCPASALRKVGAKVSIFIDKEAAEEVKLGKEAV